MHSSSEAAREALQTMKPAKSVDRVVTRLLAIALMASLAACSGMGSQPSEPAESNEVTHELAGTRWALVRLGDKTVTISEGGREAYIALNSVETRVVGYAGCNRISSSYQTNGAQLSFGEVVATRMFCSDMPTETALLDAMKATAGWRISGSQLDLFDANKKSLATFEARNL
jgi:heat shock protein HslJ